MCRTWTGRSHLDDILLVGQLVALQWLKSHALHSNRSDPAVEMSPLARVKWFEDAWRSFSFRGFLCSSGKSNHIKLSTLVWLHGLVLYWSKALGVHAWEQHQGQVESVTKEHPLDSYFTVQQGYLWLYLNDSMVSSWSPNGTFRELVNSKRIDKHVLPGPRPLTSSSILIWILHTEASTCKCNSWDNPLHLSFNP